MNKKGFIATSLILTFFLLFCAILLGVISNYNFNTNLIDKLKENLNSDVNSDTNDNGNGIEIDMIDTGTDVTIAAVIYKLNEDGNAVPDPNAPKNSFPTGPEANQYATSIECKDKSGNVIPGVGKIIWNWTEQTDTTKGGKWVFSLSNITDGGVTCIVTFTKTNFPAPDHWYTAESGTLLHYLRQNNRVYPKYGNEEVESAETIVRTKPGKVVADSKEALLSMSEDENNKMSYYFRGNGDMINNYVVFANKCWRIVRITGDGAIKLSLINNGGSSCTTKNWPTSYFSNSDISTIELTYLNNNIIKENTILTSLKSWYDTNIIGKDYEKQLYDVIWCSDKSPTSSPSPAYYRVSPAGTTDPTFICPSSAIKYTADAESGGNGLLKVQAGTGDGTGFKRYKVGLLTVDELAFSGYVYGANTSNYCYDCYLNSKASYNFFWTYSYYNSAQVFIQYDNFSSEIGHTSYITFTNKNSTGSHLYLRPVVALNPDVKISNTNFTNIGSSSNPYVIVTPSTSA